ncbi:hypothetical protein D3C74_266650 [compost metagenome]
MQIGRKIYYDTLTGEVLIDVGEHSGFVRETTKDEDFSAYAVLAERVPESVGLIQLEYGAYALEFRTCNGYKVNTETLELEFSYPDPSAPQEQPLNEVDIVAAQLIKLELLLMDIKKQVSVLGYELVGKELSILDLIQQNRVLGSSQSALELQMLAIKGGQDASV